MGLPLTVNVTPPALPITNRMNSLCVNRTESPDCNVPAKKSSPSGASARIHVSAVASSRIVARSGRGRVRSLASATALETVPASVRSGWSATDWPVRPNAAPPHPCPRYRRYPNRTAVDELEQAEHNHDEEHRGQHHAPIRAPTLGA